MTDKFEITGDIDLFPHKGGWHFVRVPIDFAEAAEGLGTRGLIPISITLGETRWDSSLMPMGDGTHFIALSARVRKAENLKVGDRVNLAFTFRDIH